MNYPELKGKKVLVTGANGYLGSWMVEKIVTAGADCVAMVGPRNACKWLDDIRHETTQIRSDLRSCSVNTLEREVGQVDHIFHMAAVGVNQNEDNIREVAEVNIRGLMTVLAFGQAVGAQSIVVTGSGFEYPAGLMIDETTLPEPRSFYALSKSAATMACIGFAKNNSIPICVLRPFVVYGPREADHRLVTQVCRAALENQPLDITSGTQQRDWIYVEDAIEAHLLAALSPKAKGEIINVASGEAVSVQEVAKEIVRLSGADQGLLKFGARSDRPNEIMEQTGDPGKAKSLLGWSRKTSLADGVAKTLDWYRQHA